MLALVSTLNHTYAKRNDKQDIMLAAVSTLKNSCAKHNNKLVSDKDYMPFSALVLIHTEDLL